MTFYHIDEEPQFPPVQQVVLEVRCERTITRNYTIVKYHTISSVGRILINAQKIPFPRGDSDGFLFAFTQNSANRPRMISSRFHTCVWVTGSDVGGDTFPTREIRAHEFSHANGHLELVQQFRRSLRYPRWNPRDTLSYVGLISKGNYYYSNK